jgi:hypothetical protein
VPPGPTCQSAPPPGTVAMAHRAATRPPLFGRSRDVPRRAAVGPLPAGVAPLHYPTPHPAPLSLPRSAPRVARLPRPPYSVFPSPPFKREPRCVFFSAPTSCPQSSPAPSPLAAGPPPRTPPPRRSHPPPERRRAGHFPPPHHRQTFSLRLASAPLAWRIHRLAVVLEPKTLPSASRHRAAGERATAPSRARAASAAGLGHQAVGQLAFRLTAHGRPPGPTL